MAEAGSAQNESRVAQIPAVWRYFVSDGAAVAVAMAFVMQCSDRAGPKKPEGPFSFSDLIWGLKLAARAAPPKII